MQLINIVQMVEHLVKQGKPIINHEKQLANLMKNKAIPCKEANCEISDNYIHQMR